MVRICEVMREAAVSRKNKLINTCHSITIAPTSQSLEGCFPFSKVDCLRKVRSYAVISYRS